MNTSQNLRSLAQIASTPELSGTLRELADQVECLEASAFQAEEMKAEVPAALRERAPVLEGRGWINAMRRRIEQLEGAQGQQRSPEGDVRGFHYRFGHAVPSTPTDLPPELARFRARLILEEARELAEALEAHAKNAERSVSGLVALAELDRAQLPSIAGEACDLLYVTLGTLIAAGLPVQPFWDEVHRANMDKQPNPEGGKPLKPAGWKPPDLREVLNQCRSSS